MFYVLTYQLAHDYIEKRTPYRSLHFAYLTGYKEKGQFLLGGAFDDQETAMLIFKVHDKSIIEEFAKHDPYVMHGVATSWDCRQWNMVTGDVMVTA